MKRLLTSALFLCCMATTFAQFTGSGAGTESDPYLIFNPIQLNQLRNYLNQTGVYFKLMNDIDLTEYIDDEYPSQGWLPIGTSSTPFKGILDGNGKTISGLWINRGGTDYVGLFANLNGGTVKHLTLKGSSIVGKDRVGLLTGADGTIENCTFSGSVSGNSYVGGCAGYGGSISCQNCTISGSVSGTTYVGGCAGYGGSFNSVTSTVSVTATGDRVGGISGGFGAFNFCTVKTIFVKGSSYVGGICGSEDYRRDISSCYVYTNVSGNDYVGGICGYAESSNIPNITECGFVGDVTANAYVGGICGEYAGKATMNGCFAIGHIAGSGNCVGGIIGNSSVNGSNSNQNNVTNCYFSGSVVGKEQVGGLIGNKYWGGVQYCYANATVTGSKSVGGLCGKMECLLKSNVSIVTSVKATEGNVGRIYGERGAHPTIGAMGTSEENRAYNRAIIVSQGVAQDAVDGEQHGTGVSSTTLKLKATYVAMGWDFNDTWRYRKGSAIHI